MPSSYTSLLRFELPVQGELSGTWGNVVNTAITTPVSEAIAGTTSISVGATDYTLTNGDGASANEARKMFITATGSPGATRSVICPSASKLYVFFNNTSDGSALIFRTSGSGITVPSGQRRLLYCDGTNVVEAVNGFGSLTLGTALAATSGGTGQSSYAVGDLLYASSTTALSKLTAVATGNVLRAKGVGVAPAWEPVALATDVSGVLPIANGGTGQTTAATAFDALKQAATDTYVGAVELATTAEVQAGTDTARAMTPSSFRGGALVQGVAQNTTSGTSIDFAPPSAGIPSWAKRITIMFSGVSTNGTSPILVQIGDSGGIETTGYESEAWYQNAVGAFLVSTNGFIIDTTNTASFTSSSRFGIMQICNLSGNNWVYVANIFAAVHNSVSSCAGGKTLSGTLDRIRLTTVGGTDTFDAGSVNILYE